VRTYVPGQLGWKLALTGVGVAILLLGVAAMWTPARVWLTGHRELATVVRVVKTKPGLPDEEFTVKQPIKPDPNREAVFWHHVACADGVVRRLNVAAQVEPVYQVGDQLRAAYRADVAGDAVAVFDPRTWAPGLIVAGIGAVWAGLLGLTAFYARRPIEIPDDTPGHD
jgi:hypothetical protein